ncbi:MAG: hypothetical protein KDA57_20845 [Planctomycetales bacterium]|nr:hypothetical protein [Planctomycetales bacterium]
MRTLFAAISLLGLLLGSVAWFVNYLSRIPKEVTLVCEIAPSNAGNKVAFVRVHGEILDKWSGVRDSIAAHTGHNTYPESVRLTLLNVKEHKKCLDLGGVDISGSPAWARDDSLLAYVSAYSELNKNDERKRLQIYDVTSDSSDTVFVANDWFIRSLSFSPESKHLAFVENYNNKNLRVLDIDSGNTTVLASGVNSFYVRWAVDGKSVFCIRNGLEIWQIAIEDKSKAMLFKGKDMNENYPNILTPSPDGRQLGFAYAGAFHSLDLETQRVARWFDCHHYFITFDWSNEGICYLDAVDEDAKKMARVMVYDPIGSTRTEVDVGPYAHVAWLREGVLVVRKDNTELWELTVQDKAMKRLFPVSSD